jgi:SEC-C motif-containing protein
LKFSVNDSCPCGSTKKYKKCCKTFHDKIIFPKTALELMKSRYSAYATSNAKYIIETTHKDNPDFTDNIKEWENDILIFCNNTKFIGLEILEFIDDENESYVMLKANMIQQGNDVSFIEKSRFLKVDGKWLYVDGKFEE